MNGQELDLLNIRNKLENKDCQKHIVDRFFQFE